MPNAFNNATTTNFGTTSSTTYTVPASTTAVVIGLVASNKLTQTIHVTVNVGGIVLGSNIPIPQESSLSLLDNKIVLKAAQTITIVSDTASAGDFIVSVLESS